MIEYYSITQGTVLTAAVEQVICNSAMQFRISFMALKLCQLIRSRTWCNELEFNHIIFLIDCCASGLAFSAKSGNYDQNNQLVNALSGNGSRVVLTAGTAEQKTYADETRNRIGMSTFTKAFLDAFQESNESIKGRGFITITDIYAHVEKQVGSFASQNKKELTPRMWSLQDKEYRGTFVFFNPNVKKSKMPKEFSEVLNVKSGDQTGYINNTKGDIRIYSLISGTLYIDQKSFGRIAEHSPRLYSEFDIGEHEIEVRNPDKND